MATLAEKNSKITVLKIDIHDAGSPVARQYRIEKIPFFEIYDEEGELIARDQKAVKWLNKAMKKAKLSSE